MRRAARLLLFISVLAPMTAKAAPGFLVVIDAGHGGADRGATVHEGGRLIAEKELTLRLALATAQELRAHGIRVVLTREEDRDVALTERTALANRLGAQVFLSLHMNSAADGKSGEGVETYILNGSSDKASRRLADLENAVLTGSVARGHAATDVSLIIKDLLIDGNLTDSKRLACAVQGQLVHGAHSGARNRGVRQALFYVLLGADMPSALVEAGFLDNPKDRHRLMDTRSRRELAKAIAQAVLSFRDTRRNGRHDGRVASMRGLGTCLVR